MGVQVKRKTVLVLAKQFTRWEWRLRIELVLLKVEDLIYLMSIFSCDAKLGVPVMVVFGISKRAPPHDFLNVLSHGSLLWRFVNGHDVRTGIKQNKSSCCFFDVEEHLKFVSCEIAANFQH